MSKTARLLVTWIAAALAVLAVFVLFPGLLGPIVFAPTPSSMPEGVREADLPPSSPPSPSAPAVRREPVEVVASDLRVPWEIAFLPDGDMLVTERGGTLRRLGRRTATITVPDVSEVGEGGLMGLALHPDLEKNGWIYLCFTARRGLENRIVRYVFDGAAIAEPKVLVTGIPGNQYHDGCRIGFGPDGYLYATTGDAGSPEAAQDTSLLAGKVLRMGDGGEVPADNPFGNLVWSYGHRNPQGIAWDDDGRLWSTEHGRSGAASGYDEINLIEKGVNYGWPAIQGPQAKAGMRAPAAQSGASETWAPAGAAWAGGKLYFAGLRGVSLYEARTNADGTVSDLRAHFRGDYGRLRAVTLGPDGALYVSTSNKDGRGRPREGDDRILRIDLSALK